MRYFLSLVLIIVLLSATFPATAQGDVTFERLEIEIWPEYDRPDVLVILRATLASTTTLPAQLTIRIPKAAGNPFALAMKDIDGMLYNLPYETEISDDWMLISFTSPSPDIQLEYYDPSLIIDGDRREFSFLWQTDYAAENVQVRVQQPMGATEIRLTPDLGSGALGADGYTYFSAPLGSVKTKSTIRLGVEYTRGEPSRSATGIPVQPVAPLDEPIAGRMDVQELWPWGLVALGILLLAGGIFWYVQTERKSSKPERKRHAPSTPEKSAGEKSSDKKAPASNRRITGPLDQPHIYCHRCGKRAQRGDVFCRTCGTKFRFE